MTSFIAEGLSGPCQGTGAWKGFMLSSSASQFYARKSLTSCVDPCFGVLYRLAFGTKTPGECISSGSLSHVAKLVEKVYWLCVVLPGQCIKLSM